MILLVVLTNSGKFDSREFFVFVRLTRRAFTSKCEGRWKNIDLSMLCWSVVLMSNFSYMELNWIYM